MSEFLLACLKQYGFPSSFCQENSQPVLSANLENVETSAFEIPYPFPEIIAQTQIFFTHAKPGQNDGLPDDSSIYSCHHGRELDPRVYQKKPWTASMRHVDFNRPANRFIQPPTIPENHAFVPNRSLFGYDENMQKTI